MRRRIIVNIGSFGLLLSMGAATAWLLVNPVAARAATCTADCGNGRSVTCEGRYCGAIDGNKCWQSNGDYIYDIPCKGYGDDEVLPVQ